jgi:hypothetical protein
VLEHPLSRKRLVQLCVPNHSKDAESFVNVRPACATKIAALAICAGIPRSIIIGTGALVPMPCFSLRGGMETVYLVGLAKLNCANKTSGLPMRKRTSALKLWIVRGQAYPARRARLWNRVLKVEADSTFPSFH